MLSKRWRTLQCPVTGQPPPRPNIHLQELNCGLFRDGPGWDAPHYISSDDEAVDGSNQEDEEIMVAADQDDEGMADQEDDERQGDEHQAD